MKDFLKKIGLIKYLNTEIEISKNEFVTKFKKQVDEGNTGFFSDIFDVFSSNKNEYKGHVGFEDFKIKRKKRFFDMNMNMAVAQGTYRQNGNNLIIETEINGFNGMMIPFYLFAIVFYIIFIGVFLTIDDIEGNGAGFALPFILIHAVLMFGLPYFMMKRSIKRTKRELEREFYYMTK